MALVKYGGGITQMSGSIAGNVFARNRFGNYARARTTPTNPNTSAQQDVRSVIASLSEKWSQTLTAANRTAWNLYADNVAMLNRLGESIHLTGYNHYIRSNATRHRLAQGLANAGPVVFELPEHDPTFAITISEATQQVTAVYDSTRDWANENQGYLWLFQGTPQNAQRNFFDGPWLFCSSVLGVAGAPPASPAVRDLVKVCTEGQHVWFYARIERADGRISTPFRADTFCAA